MSDNGKHSVLTVSTMDTVQNVMLNVAFFIVMLIVIMLIVVMLSLN